MEEQQRTFCSELLSDTQLENWRRKQIQSGHFKHFLKNIISDGFLFYSANTGGTPTTCDRPWLLLASSILKHKDGNFRTERKFNATRIYKFATENPKIRGKKTMNGKAWKWHTSVQNQLNRWRPARRGRGQPAGETRDFSTHFCFSRSGDNNESMIDR